MTTEPRESVLRLLWQATMPEVLVWTGGFIVLSLIQGWITWHSADHSLAAVASGSRFPIFLIGNSLLLTRLVADSTERPKWVKRFKTRWPALADPWRDGLTILEPRSKTIADGTETTGPGAAAVAQPMLTGLGAACIGFAFGLNVIAAFSHDQRWSEPRGLTILLGLAMALCLAGAIQKVTGMTRRLYAWSQDAAAAAATAQAVSDRARIAALQAQMNPHFMFNALNTVASLLGTDSAGARRTVQNLSAMLTHTLQRSAEPLATVEDEVQFARDYLDIERERFGSRLQVTYAVDPETTAMTVPTMSLQPLVENAVKHAVANRLEGGHIRISATKLVHGSSLRLSVEDDGPGFAPGSGAGTGLANLRARLRSLYGARAQLDVEPRPTGARVSITIPHYAHPDR